MDKTSILIVEDEPEFLRVYCDAIASEPSFDLVGAVTTLGDALALAEKAVPDVLVVDLGLPDGSGTELIRRACQLRPDCDVLVVTVFGDDRHVLDAIAAGATGYILKDSPAAELLRCIRELRAGGSPISPSIARRLLARMRGPEPDQVQTRQDNPLTEREADILRLVAKGLSFADVGSVLGISAHTVVAHVKNIYRKLSVHSRGEAVFEAGQMGLL
ncbi:MAG TPA: response regulator transcription factor [Burkholderiales bacterium]|jgi:DNA-binding NarL/FixJ family response regulator|nr:response regulator transcription factor [Burkholderiales bacterium]